MYPPLWGYLFWFFVHASAKNIQKQYEKATSIPADMVEHMRTFLLRLCRYLPCPGCRIHCGQYVQVHHPTFQYAAEFWNYTVQFHNAVNERNKKLSVTNEEAEASLAKSLSEFSFTFDTLSDAFLQDWWNVVILTTFFMSTSADKPSDEEKSEYRKFLVDLFSVAPFSFKTTPDGQLIRNMLLSEIEKMNLDTKEITFDSVTQLHNYVSMYFHILPKTTQQMKETFNTRFDLKNHSEITRAAQQREEDHKKMGELQKEIHSLRQAQLLGGCDTSTQTAYQNATIVLSSVLGLLIVAIIVIGICYKKGKWHLVRETPTKNGVKEMNKNLEKFDRVQRDQSRRSKP